MGITADVLVVAGRDDPVADRVCSALNERGRTSMRMEGPEAAREFTIELTSRTVSVEPSVPMFIRASAWWSKLPAGDLDATFLRSEQYATLWAAANLSEAPVLNRPRRRNAPERFSWGQIAARVKGIGDGRPGEIYASRPEWVIGADVKEWWGEDVCFRVAPLAELSPDVPLRARQVNPEALYEVVTVVGGEGFPATTDSRTQRLGLVDQSVGIAQVLGLQFAAISWAVDHEGAVPALVNANPGESDVMYTWDDIAEALIGALTA